MFSGRVLRDASGRFRRLTCGVAVERWVSGKRPNAIELVAGMTDEQIAEAAQVLLDYTRAACLWVETRHQYFRG